MERKPRAKKINTPKPAKKSLAKKSSTQEVHFIRVLKQANKIREMREELNKLHGEALRTYLLREFGAGKKGEEFRRFSEKDLAGFRQMLIDGCNQWLRAAGKKTI